MRDVIFMSVSIEIQRNLKEPLSVCEAYMLHMGVFFCCFLVQKLRLTAYTGILKSKCHFFIRELPLG